MRKRLLALAFIINCLISVCAYGQMTFGSIDSGPYGIGSSITIPLNLGAGASSYNINNVFSLWISGPNGNFAQEQQIGTYKGFFTTFINGKIPAGLVAGKYKLRVKSTSTTDSYVFPQDIDILPLQGPVVGAEPAANQILGEDAYGWCGSAVGASKSMVLKDKSVAPTIERLFLKNEVTGTVQEYDKGPAGFSLENLPIGYYTITVTAETFTSGAIVKSSRSYLLLNVPSSVSVSGIGYGCIDPDAKVGADVSYLIDTKTENGIKNNYPGMTYRVTWGDGQADVFTHALLMSKAGALSHSYSKSSCGEPAIDLGNGNKISNAFKLTASAISPFCQLEPGSATTYPKIYTKPIAKIDPSTATTACLNVPLVITNTSIRGTNSDCTLNMSYAWYVDGKLLSTEDVLKYTFTTTGMHSIKLVAKNDLELCAPSEDTRNICIQAQPVPSFNFNGNDGAVVCLPGNLKPNNTSIIDNTCNPDNTFQWNVTGPAVGYADGTNATSKEPVFAFTTPGVYKISLSVTTASCGLFSTPEQTVIVNGLPASTLSPDVKLCNLGVYTFDDITPGPTKTVHTGTFQDLAETYHWTVTGGAFSYADATTETSKYPHIVFSEYKTYNISVTQQNTCESVTASQQITFIPSPVIDAGAAQTICFEQDAQLAGRITGEVTSASWVGGLGSFSPNRNTLNATYSPTPAERSAGTVNLTLHATTVLADPCSSIDAYTSITIIPQVSISSAAAVSTCRNVPLNYTITSNVPGTQFTWTASGSKNAGGFQTAGTGSLINDVITNSDPATDAQVVYTITPTNAGCAGTPFQLTVTVAEIKNSISNATPVVCSGQEITIVGAVPTGGNSSYVYSWEQSVDGTTWQKIDGATAKDLTLIVPESIHVRRLVNSGACDATSNVIDVSALPPLSNNTISGEQAICKGNLSGPLTGTLPAGGDGNYSYQWQGSVDAGVTWSTVVGANLKDYSPGAVTQTTLYRRLVSTTSCSGKLQSISNGITITVNEPALAAFSFTADKSCSPFVIDDKNIVAETPANRNSTYTWLVNNQVIGTGAAFPGYTIQTDSTAVVVTLITTSPFGCSSDTLSHAFSTQQRVVASFSQDLTEGCGPTSVRFKNTTPVLAGTTYAWDFGNGNTATSAEPAVQNYLPSASGRDTTYFINLTINTNCGSTSQASQLLVRALPVSVFSPNKTTGCSPLVVSFSNTSPGDANTYIYDFGDGTPVLRTTGKAAFTHTFVSGVTKDFVVSMVTENACGRSEPSQYTIRVTPVTILPELVVNSTEKEGCAPLTVNFRNNSVGGSSYYYDFGDGTTTGPTHLAPEVISHTFTKGGTYTVKLRATNGCSDTTTTETIVVYPQPNLLFSAEQTTGCPSLSVKFKNQSTDAVSYQWDFGDGSPVSTEAEPEHVYTGDREFYNVTLTAVNSRACGNSLTKSQFVHIVQPPVARFDVLPAAVISIPNYTFRFEDQSENRPEKWTWTFGDGTTSAERNPTHVYADTGLYKVTLRVSNSLNCFTEISKDVQITGVPGYLFVPNAFMPNSSTPELREFRVKGSGIASWNMQIFNKWGELLWQTDKLEDGRPAEFWNGIYKSDLLPQGVYFWKIEVQMINKFPWKGMSYNGSTPKRTGTINLIR